MSDTDEKSINRVSISIYVSTYHIKNFCTLDLRVFDLIVFVVPAEAVVEIEVLTDAGVVNIDVPAAFEIDSDVLNDAEKLGPGSSLPGPVLGRTLPTQIYSR